ncbi:MAG TPA: DUF5615 family PIN-like protein [Gemmataceae bacterium]|nr:DUF5615 family PIN-like protein [Gemmataceae bacterium]
MNLYRDDDSVDALLVRLLRQAGHDVELPLDVGLAGKEDPIHFMHAIEEDRVLLTHNHQDFENLHNLVMLVHGHHPGLPIVRKENNPKRDLDERGIIRAINKLLASGLPISDHMHILNHWR